MIVVARRLGKGGCSAVKMELDNYSNRTRSMYFRVTIDPAEFFVRAGSGGGVGSYRINLVTIGSL